MIFNDFRVSEDQAGGEYTIRFNPGIRDMPPSFRKFRIGTYSHPEMFVTCDFEKNAYSPGDEVKAKIKVRKPDGEALPVGTSIAYHAGEVNAQNILLSNQGETNITFTIPAFLEKPALALTVLTYMGYSQQDGSSQPDVSTHSVPIVDHKFNINLFIEQRDYLIQNVPNKVYFQAVSAPEKADAKVNHIQF